jgi:sporulation protein YlmC with PRC-barrel domain
MIDLPTKAEVYCSDGIAGLTTYVIGDPVNHQVTHLVVKSLKPTAREYLVPIDVVEDTMPHRINLKCTRDAMENMEPFTDEEYLRTNVPSYLVSPYIVPDVSIVTGSNEQTPVYVRNKHRNIPPGELSVWRNAKVEATDGYIGQVDALMIDANTRQVTHLVLLERHIFEQKEITIPASQIECVNEDTIYLKLDRQSVEALPTTPPGIRR